jgi:hypothetical protein
VEWRRDANGSERNGEERTLQRFAGNRSNGEPRISGHCDRGKRGTHILQAERCGVRSFSDAHTHCDTYSAADTYSDTKTVTNTNSNSYTYTDANCDADTNTDAEAIANSDANTNCNSNANPNCNSDTVA